MGADIRQRGMVLHVKQEGMAFKVSEQWDF